MTTMTNPWADYERLCKLLGVEASPGSYGLDAMAADEIERLRTRYDSATDQAVRYADDNARLVAALEMISGKRQCIDNLMSDKDIARRALEPKP